MIPTTNARVAGVTFLFYIAATITSIVLFGAATAGDGLPDRLAAIAQHATDVRLTVVISLLLSLSALVLAVTLYGITRHVDADLALLAFACRVAEGIGGMDVSRTLGLLWLATAPDTSATSALGGFFLKMEGMFNASALFFAVGSLIFSSLLLRGRLVPVALAWLGVLASLVLVGCLPLQLAGLLDDVGGFTAVARLMWYPMLVFEICLGVWLLIKGAATPSTSPTA